MADYRNLDFDPVHQEDRRADPSLRPANVVWGWIVAAVLVAAVAAVVFGMIHHPPQIGTHTASNDVAAPTAPPAVTHMMPPAVAPGGTPSPRTTAPKPPISPVPPAPGQPSGGQ